MPSGTDTRAASTSPAAKRVVRPIGVEKQHVRKIAGLAGDRDRRIGGVAVVAHRDRPRGIVVDARGARHLAAARRDHAAFRQHETAYEIEIELLLIDGSIAVVPRVFRPCVGVAVGREIRIAPRRAGLARQERSQIRIDADRHDGRLAAAVDHFAIRKRRRPGATAEPAHRAAPAVRACRVGHGGVEVERRIRAICALFRIGGPEERARAARAYLERELHFERIGFVGGRVLADRIVGRRALARYRRPRRERAVVARLQSERRIDEAGPVRAHGLRDRRASVGASSDDRIGNVAHAGEAHAEPVRLLGDDRIVHFEARVRVRIVALRDVIEIRRQKRCVLQRADRRRAQAFGPNRVVEQIRQRQLAQARVVGMARFQFVEERGERLRRDDLAHPEQQLAFDFADERGRRIPRRAAIHVAALGARRVLRALQLEQRRVREHRVAEALIVARAARGADRVDAVGPCVLDDAAEHRGQAVEPRRMREVCVRLEQQDIPRAPRTVDDAHHLKEPPERTRFRVRRVRRRAARVRQPCLLPCVIVVVAGVGAVDEHVIEREPFGARPGDHDDVGARQRIVGRARAGCDAHGRALADPLPCDGRQRRRAAQRRGDRNVGMARDERHERAGGQMRIHGKTPGRCGDARASMFCRVVGRMPR